jgi:hypothetical protein
MSGVSVVPTRRTMMTAPLLALSMSMSMSMSMSGGCADDLKPSPGPADAGGDVAPVSSVRAGDNVTTTVDATWPDTWVYFDFETGAEAVSPDTTGARSWDLAFQRFKVKANGGVNGTAGVEVAMIENRTLDAVDAAPASGWLLDAPDGDDGNPDPDTVFNRGEDTWFSYDTGTHVLMAKPRIYVVRTADDGYFAVQVLRYYDEAGNPGFLQFRWKRVQAPTGRIPAPPVATPDGGADAGAG